MLRNPSSDPVPVAPRLDLAHVGPQAYAAMLGLEEYVRRSSLPKRTLHLVKLRASFLNGCTFCIDMHSREAQQAGETATRLFAVASWRESSRFTLRERAALALTDAVTRLGSEGVPDEVWREASAVWSEAEMVDLLMAIVAMNGWNRLAIATRKQPPEDAPR